MIDGYMTIREAAEKWGLQVRRVQAMCAQDRIKGAAKLGTVWAIPVNAERPKDLRQTTGAYKNWRKKSYAVFTGSRKDQDSQLPDKLE